MSIEITQLGPGDEHRLEDVADDVFDARVRPGLVRELLADPRLHLVVATERGRVIGFASGVHYVHPDKAPELWVNEVSVAPAFRRRGIASRLLGALFEAGAVVGCRQAWVLTERENEPARQLYASSGGREPKDEIVMFEFDLARPRASTGGDP